MTIPTRQLETWSKQGATQTPKLLREKIESILTGPNSKIQSKNQLDIYLQGSYRNGTSIYGNSDVDIVVQNNAIFSSDVTNLNTNEKTIFNEVFNDATYTFEEFKSDVIKTLIESFGSNNVEIGNKSIKIEYENYEADVVPCFEYRKYTSFGQNIEDRKCLRGIIFYTKNEKRKVINYPKKHYLKGVEKNQRVNERYKPTIRIFKNIKKKLVEKNIIMKSEAPSYFVENLLYNIPDYCFDVPDISKRVFNVLEWLQDNRENMSGFICQNEQINLFGDGNERWEQVDAKKFIDECIKLSNEWDN